VVYKKGWKDVMNDESEGIGRYGILLAAWKKGCRFSRLVSEFEMIRLLTQTNEESLTVRCVDDMMGWALTPYSSVLLEKLIVAQLVKKLPAFYGTRTCIIVFTRARHLSLS
jgi:hypothetical protein